MSRLVDYFVVVGFDHEKERSGMSSGVILQRFPETNWEDAPFHEGLEWFCQPQGWALSTTRKEPCFFVSVLTDIEASRHYCACLCFSETVSVVPARPPDEDEEAVSVTRHSVVYAPKCLLLVSRQDYEDTFRNCLGVIYTVWIENMGVELESVVGNLVGGVVVPPAGGPQVRFSVGAGDRQALQPSAAPALPVTRAAVNMLLELLGIHNAVTLWCAVMSEHKVLLVSLGSARLSGACRALAALMFPFRYAHVYIPLLPAALLEVLATPTPFLIGIHSSLRDEVPDLLDVIVADLDVGSLLVPPSLHIPRPAPHLLASLQEALALVLQPGLRQVDCAFAAPAPAPSPPHMRDKEIRAVFMRTLAQLLQGYRSCLTIIRMHPGPVLTFHKAGWLGARGLAGCEFTQRLLNSMFFNGYVAERGPPWRVVDLLDTLIQKLPEQLRAERLQPERELQHIQELAAQLHLNENPAPQTYQQNIPRPPEGAGCRLHQPSWPRLDAARVAAVIAEATARNSANPKLTSLRAPQPRIVPLGAPPTGASEHDAMMVTNSARRLEVLSECVVAIFEWRYADARKALPAVQRALAGPAARAALTADLAARLPGHRSLLHHHQFDLVVRLMNCALQSATAFDEHSVAAAILPLSTSYCRKLCTGVFQYAYMCIQDHAIWHNQQFWESAFYQDVQREIKALYVPNSPQRSSTIREDAEMLSVLRAQEPSALEIAAEQMRLWPTMSPEKQREVTASEESTLYSQAIHYANRMVYLLLPLDARAERCHGDDDRQSSLTNSVAESDSADAESGFEEAEPGEAGNNVIKMVSRFVDKVCTEGGVTAEHVRCLHQMIPGAVHMHLETLETVARESRRLPPVQKPRILTPTLLAGESVMSPALRAFLVADGRESPLLPAEGALFLTNYRIIFKGTPTDPFACEQSVVRCFPVCSLTREKTVRTAHVDQTLQEGLQLRSCTFQLIKVGLDEEVSSEQLETFRKALARLRHPQHPLQHFAFAGRAPPPPPPPNHDKHATLKGFAKKTLLSTARAAGLKPKPSKRQRYVVGGAAGAGAGPGAGRSLTAPTVPPSHSADTLSLEEGEGGECGEVSDARTLERLGERAYARDWQRLGLADPPFRLCRANVLYSLCRSYPALFPVPASVEDESLRRVARCYRQTRLPLVTWRHQRTGALLVRSAGSHYKGVMGLIKGSTHQTQNASQGGAETTSSLEQERYLSAVCACTPAPRALRDSCLSLDSLFLCAEDALHTPVLNKATLGAGTRGSGGKGAVAVNAKHFGRWGSLKDRRSGAAHLELYARQRLSAADNDSVSEVGCSGLRRASLYVLVDKGGGGCAGGCAGVESVPVDYPDARAAKHAFKKLMRACVPSGHQDQPGFYKLIEESGWMWQLRQLLQLSGVVVDLLDLQGSSVLLSLEEGWDATAQVCALAQLCLEPYYRTIEGFRVLLEKEWLAAGHRFQTRCNVGAQPQQGFTPTFIQFLDVVHQIMKQFPLAFEFNEYYVRFVAYHSVSCRFRTFLLDSEAERAELGIAAADDKRGSLTTRLRGVETGANSEDEGVYPGGAPTRERGALGQSLLDHIDKLHQRSPVFYNFLYSPDIDNPVLRPQCGVCSLEVWSYYTSEQLGRGPAYDQETLCDVAPARLVTAGYDNIARCMPDAFSGMLERTRQTELELGHLPQKWRVRWEQLDLPNTCELTRSESLNLTLVRRHARLAHKRATLEVLVQGRLAALPPPAHRLLPNPHTAPAHCDHCSELLWGPGKASLRCCDCGAVCHERCADQLSVPCSKYKPAPPPQHHHDADSLASSAATLQSCARLDYNDFVPNVAENRTHEGYLYKRGALLKGWKPRWFVLDSMKHQLRYYDAVEDSHCKGFIDLAEVIAVSPAPPAPGPPKKTDDRSFFDLKTSRRTYNFCAGDANSAQEWIEKLQASLQ